MSIPRIYLAGRVSKNDWRHDLGVYMRGRFTAEDLPTLYKDKFPAEKAELDGHRYIYTGPWFIGCDHGGFHGPSNHGVGLVDAEPLCCQPTLPEGWSEGTSRRALAQLCYDAIDSSHVVIAWLEEGAYGTVAEVGYARAKGKLVIVGGPASKPRDDLWFAAASAGQVIEDGCATPREFFLRVLGIVAPKHMDVCESPMEARLLEAFQGVGFVLETEDGRTAGSLGDLTLGCQFDVNPYRLDFAVFNDKTNRKIAVEVDGHDFHERTKEQASKDRARDRELQRRGWQVFRFTGSDVYRSAHKCASEVVEAASTP